MIKNTKEDLEHVMLEDDEFFRARLRLNEEKSREMLKKYIKSTC